MTEDNFARLYATMRGSKGFLFGLIGFVAVWLSAHFLLGIDREFGMLNLFLSLEASISLAFFSMLSDKQDAAQEAHLKAIEALEERILARIGEANGQSTR